MEIPEPAAIAKAESLLKFAQARGAPLKAFQLTLTHDEAMGLLAFYEAQWFHVEQFQADLTEARKTDNPWLILENFELYGFRMIPVELLH